MGSNSSVQDSQGQMNSGLKEKQDETRLSPKKILFSSNGQKIRQPDSSLLKKNSINSSNNNKLQPSLIGKSNQSITQTIIYDKKSIHDKSENKPQQTQNSINLNESQSLYDGPNFVQSLWNFLLNQSSNKPQLSFESFSQLILTTLEAIKQKFYKKIKKGEIYPVFSNAQQSKDYEKDIQIFEIALKNRVHKYFSVSKKHPNHSGVQKYKQEIKQTIQTLGNTIICELMGKTSIWRSLMLLKQEQQQKVMEMLEKQGIDQKHLRQISQAQIL